MGSQRVTQDVQPAPGIPSLAVHAPHSRPRVRLRVVDLHGAQPQLAVVPADGVEVISISTGTKCINGEYMSDRGLALNDCHAEIIARRSLLRFLYTQLEVYLK